MSAYFSTGCVLNSSAGAWVALSGSFHLAFARDLHQLATNKAQIVIHTALGAIDPFFDGLLIAIIKTAGVADVFTVVGFAAGAQYGKGTVTQADQL